MSWRRLETPDAVDLGRRAIPELEFELIVKTLAEAGVKRVRDLDPETKAELRRKMRELEAE